MKERGIGGADRACVEQADADAGAPPDACSFHRERVNDRRANVPGRVTASIKPESNR